MLSVANVRSAGGAAGYFAKDNYYTQADADRSDLWVGKGAERLGLIGSVEPRIFEAVLRGELPQGGRIGREGVPHRATDLTFSLPKSWSLLALVGKDERIIAAYRSAVIETLQWAERNAAFIRAARAAPGNRSGCRSRRACSRSSPRGHCGSTGTPAGRAR